MLAEDCEWAATTLIGPHDYLRRFHAQQATRFDAKS
jgi:hypothetical protein